MRAGAVNIYIYIEIYSMKTILTKGSAYHYLNTIHVLTVSILRPSNNALDNDK